MARRVTKKPAKAGRSTGREPPVIPEAPPLAGEETQAQHREQVAGAFTTLEGFKPVPSGSYYTYRQMRGNPTIAMARMAATAPVRAADWSVETDDAPDEQVDFVRTQMKQIWQMLVKDALFALDYGWAPFEKVFEVDGDGRVVYRKLKPLLVDMTEQLVDDKHGNFAGLKQRNVILPAEKCFVFVSDQEAGQIYGRPRHENCRREWSVWNSLVDRTGQYATKVAGVTPVIEYPEGRSLDATGVEKDNYELAVSVLGQLGKGQGVTMPNTLSRYAEDLVRQGVDITKLRAWQISFLEPSGSYGAEFDTLLRHFESLMTRGWLTPERAMLEGQYGTKAEAETHTDLALVVCDLLFQDLIRFVNWYLVNPLLVYNYGRKAENVVWLAPAGLDPAVKAFFREIMTGILTTPDNTDLFLTLLDVEAMLDATGLPRGKEKITAEDLRRQREQQVPPAEGDEGEPEGTAEDQAAARGLLGRMLDKLRGWGAD